MALTNSQYNKIMREYDRIRLKHAREQEERIQNVYETIPAIRELDQEITTLAAGQARKLLGGDKNSLQNLKVRMADLKEQKRILLLANGYAENTLSLQYTCDRCRDTGYVDNKKCRCFRQKEIDLLYHQSSLADILKKENFDTFSYEWYDNTSTDAGVSPREHMRKVVNICYEMAAGFTHEKQNLLLTGPAGIGKTFLTHCIAKKVLDSGFSVLYLTAEELFAIFSSHHFQDEPEVEEETKYHHIFDCDLLIIDDLGTEVVNNFTISRLFTCINERARHNRPVIISTNMTLSQLNVDYSERITSRLVSDYKILELYGDDIRVKKKIIERRRERNG